MRFAINENRGGAITRALFLVVLVIVGLDYMEDELARVLFKSKQPSPESYAISSLRKLVTSQISYRGTFGGGTYADSLDSRYASNLIDSVLASGTKDGYTFIVSASAENASFAIYVRPITYGTMGTRSLFSDETGVIRYTAEERSATADDKPLWQ